MADENGMNLNRIRGSGRAADDLSRPWGDRPLVGRSIWHHQGWGILRAMPARPVDPGLG